MILLDLRCSLRGFWFSFILIPPFLLACHRTLGAGGKVTLKGAALLCILQAGWANLHGEFLWGLVIAALFAIEGAGCALRSGTLTRADWLTRGALLAALCLACLLTPFGSGLLLGILAESSLVAFRPVSTEWLPFARFAQPLGWSAWILFTALVAAALYLGRRTLSVGCLLLTVFFALLSLRSIRFIGPYALVGIYTAMFHINSAPNLPGIPWWLPRFARVGAAAGFFFLTWSVCTDRFWHWQAELKRFGSGMITSELPVLSSEYLAKTQVEGNFLNDWSYGGFLTWHLFPRILTAEDGRTAPFPPELSQQISAIYRGDAEALRIFDQDYPLDGAVIPWNYGTVTGLLAADPGWALLFIGPHSTVWMKKASIAAQGKPHLELTEPSLREFVVTEPQGVFDSEPWLTYSTFLCRRALVFIRIGRTDFAREIHETMKTANPSEPILIDRVGALLAEAE